VFLNKISDIVFVNNVGALVHVCFLFFYKSVSTSDI